VSDKTRRYFGFGCLVVAAAVLLHGLSGGGLPIGGAHTIRGVYVRETAEQTYETERTVVALRNGPVADYLTAKGHALLIADQHAKEPNGAPSAVVTKAIADAKPIDPPLLILYDADNGRVLTKTPVPPSTSADAILDVFRKAGG
jgi:hypothetical protein